MKTTVNTAFTSTIHNHVHINSNKKASVFKALYVFKWSYLKNYRLCTKVVTSQSALMFTMQLKRMNPVIAVGDY